MNWIIKVEIKNSNICPPAPGFFVSVWGFFTLICVSFFSVCLLLLVENIQEHDPSRSILLSRLRSQETFTFWNYFLVQLEQLTGSNQSTSVWVSLVSLCCSIFCKSNFVEKKKQDNLSKQWCYVGKSCSGVLAGTDNCGMKKPEILALMATGLKSG